jgi:uncharacterized protein
VLSVIDLAGDPLEICQHLLITIFDRWFDSQDTSFSIRLFESIIRLLFDPSAGNDSLGGGRNGLRVIETDGGIEPVDALKNAARRLSRPNSTLPTTRFLMSTQSIW